MKTVTAILCLGGLVLAGLGAPVEAGQGSCPPGLAKKDPACVPPGQARKLARYPHIGDRVTGYDYHVIRYPARYGLPPAGEGWRYFIVGDRILRVDEDTYEVLDLIRAVTAILD